MNQGRLSVVEEELLECVAESEIRPLEDYYWMSEGAGPKPIWLSPPPQLKGGKPLLRSLPQQSTGLATIF